MIGLRDTPIAGRTFLLVSVRVFPEEVSIWIGWVKIILNNIDLDHFIHWGLNRKKEGGGVNLLFLLIWGIHLLPQYRCSWFSNLGIQTGTYTISPAILWTNSKLHHQFLVLQLADNTWMIFSASILGWVNFYNKSLSQLFIYSWPMSSFKFFHNL